MAENQQRQAELARDIAARRERRLEGYDDEWEPPTRQRATNRQASFEPDDVLAESRERYSARVEQEQHSVNNDNSYVEAICSLADAIGVETGRIERETKLTLQAMRDEIAALRDEVATLRGIKSSANVAMLMRSNRDA